MGQGASCENEETRGQQPQRDEQIQAYLQQQQQLQMLQNQQQYEVGQFKQVGINDMSNNTRSQQLQQTMIQFQEQQQQTKQFPLQVQQHEVAQRDKNQLDASGWMNDQDHQRIPNNNIRTNSNTQSKNGEKIITFSYPQQDIKNTQPMLPQTYHQQQHSQNLIGEKDIAPVKQQQQQQQQQQEQLSQNKIDSLRDGGITASYSYRTTLRPSAKYKPSSQIKEKQLEDPSDEDEHLSMNFSPKKNTIQSNQTQPLIAQLQVQSIQPSPSQTAVKPRFLSPHSSQTQSTAKPIIPLYGIQPVVQQSTKKTTKSPMKKQTQEMKHQQPSQQQFVYQNNINIHKQHSSQPQHPKSATLVPDYQIQKSHGLQSFGNQESSTVLKQHQKNSINALINPSNVKNEDESYKLIQQTQQFQQPHSAIEEKSNDQVAHNRIQAQQLDGFLSSSSLGQETQERQMRTPSLQQSYTVIPSTQSASSQQAIQIQQQQLQSKQQEEQLKQLKYQQEIENSLKQQQLLEQQQFQQQQQENILQQQMLIEQQMYEQQQFNINNDFKDKTSKHVLSEKNNSSNARKEISYRSSSPISSPLGGDGVGATRGRENINQLKNNTSQQPEKLQIREQQQYQKYPQQQEKNHKDYQLQAQNQDRQLNPKNKQLNARSKSKKRFIDSSYSSESPPSCNRYQDSDEERNQNYLSNTNNRNDFNNHHSKHTKSSRDISSKHSKRNNKPVGTNINHQIIEQHTRISHRHSHKNKSNTSNNHAGIANHTQYSHQASATQLHNNEDYSGFNSQAKLNPAPFYSSPSIYHQSQQQLYPPMYQQHQAVDALQNRLSVGNNGYSYPLVNQPLQPQLVSPFQMMLNTQNLSLQQQQQQNSPADFIQQQLVQSQIALAQAQQNHQAQIQGILLMQQQQQQQQQQQLQQQQLQQQFGGIFPNVPNQLVVTQLNQMNTLNQFPLANSQIDNYAKNQYQGNNYFNINNTSAGMLQPPSNLSGFMQPVCHTGSSESNHSIGTNYLSQQGQKSHLGVPQPFPIIINNNVVSPTKQLVQTHFGDNLIHVQAENNAQSQFEKHIPSNTSIDNNIKSKSKNQTNTRYLCDDEPHERQDTNPERVNNQVLADSSLSEVDQHKQNRQQNMPAKIDKLKGNTVDGEELLAQKNKDTKKGQEIKQEPDNSYSENNNSNASKLKKFNSFSEYHKNKMDADPLNLEDTNIPQQNMNSKQPNGMNQQKTLAEIFQEKRGKLAVQKMEEQQQIQQQQLGTASNKTQATGGGKRTKEEIIKLRQEMMEYGTKVNPKLKAKQQQKIHHADSDITGDVVLKEQRNKSPIYSKQKEELMIRLAQGVKPKISEKEMYALTKKNYENLPEVKKKRQEQEKQMNKSEMLKVKQEKLKELDEVDSTVVVKTFSLSQKEEKLKNKLFSGSSNQQQATRKPPSTGIPAQELPRKQTNSRNASISQIPSERSNQPSLHSAPPEDARSRSIQQQQQQQLQQQNQQLLKSGSVSPQFQQVYTQIPEEKIDQFLKQMEDEMNNINKKQVSIGMMNQQTSIIKQQNEILNENQKQLAILMEKIQNDDSISKQKQELVEQNKKAMKDLLEPINAQIEEIRSIYDQTKKTQHELEAQIAGQSAGATGNVSMQDFLKQNGQLKQKLDMTSNNLQELLPNNLNVFSTLTNYNIDVYSRTIKSLKVQIEDLQKEAQRAEIELEEREQKLNSLPNQDELLIPFQEAIQAHVDNIDFLSSHQIVLNKVNKPEIKNTRNFSICAVWLIAVDKKYPFFFLIWKLGGQLDYDEFIDSLQDMCSDSEALWREYQSNMNEHVISIPKFSLTNQELNEISYNMPSVLDDIKERLGLDPSKPMKNPGFVQKQKEQQQGFIDLSKQDLNPLTSYAKTQALRPKNLESIRTEPKQCPKEVKYEQVEPAPKSSAYQTVLPVLKEGAYKQQSQAQTPINNDAAKWKSDPFKSFPTLPGQKSVVQFNQRDKQQQDEDNQDNYEDSFENEDSLVEIKMDPQVISNLAAPYQQPKPKKATAKENEDTSQAIQIDMDNNFLEKLQIPQLGPLQQQQQTAPSLMDRESLKNIFLEVLNENKEEFFGQFAADEQSLQGDQIDDQGIENTQINNQDNDSRRKLSDVISKNSKDLAPLSLGKAQSAALSKGSYSQNVIPLQQSDRFSQAAPQLQQQQQFPSVPSASIQAQTQDLALHFLNIINSTLTQISSAVNQPQNRDNQRIGDISEGSLTDDSMEAGVQLSRGAHSRGQSIPQMAQAVPNLQPQQMQMNNYPFQMFGQMPNFQGYPGMIQQSDPRMIAFQQYQQPYQQRNQDTGAFNEAKINLNDYYKEYQLSDSDTISNQSALDMSKYDVKSNQSYAHSIFASDDQSRSNGEVSVPGRRPYGQNIERHQKPRDGQVMSDIELSQSNELSIDNFKRRQSQRQQGGSKKPATKVIGDDMWNVLSDDLSEGQI